MATRKQAREAIIQILYARELGNDKALTQASHFLDSQKIRNTQQSFALDLLHGVCEKEDYITQVMNVFLKTWDIERLGVIEKNILKLGIYEILQTNTQKAVIINEAIELTKSFSVQDAFRLVNGVLDSVAKTDSATLDNLIKEHAKKIQEMKAQESLVPQELQTTKETRIIKKDSQKPHKATKAISTMNQGRTKGGDKKAKEPQQNSQDTQETAPKKTNPAHIQSIRIAAQKSRNNAHPTAIHNESVPNKSTNHASTPNHSNTNGKKTPTKKPYSKDSRKLKEASKPQDSHKSKDSHKFKDSKHQSRPKRFQDSHQSSQKEARNSKSLGRPKPSKPKNPKNSQGTKSATPQKSKDSKDNSTKKD